MPEKRYRTIDSGEDIIVTYPGPTNMNLLGGGVLETMIEADVRTDPLQEIRNDLAYHANLLASRLKWVAIQQDDPAKIKAAITRANKFLHDMEKYEVGDG